MVGISTLEMKKPVQVNDKKMGNAKKDPSGKTKNSSSVKGRGKGSTPSKDNVRSKNTAGISKAIDAKKALLKGKNSVNIARKLHYKPRFYLPKTLKLPRTPKYPRKAIFAEAPLDNFSTIFRPLRTDKTFALLESKNTVVFTCDIRANKLQIASAFKKLFGVKPAGVRTLISPNGKKKAHIKIGKDQAAVEILSNMYGSH